MEDISGTAKGAEQGESGAVADAVIILAESGIDRDANTGGAHEESACAASLPTTPFSEYHSARIESMLSSRREFETELEYRTAHSKVHWSELVPHEQASGSGESGAGSGHQSGVDHRQYFEELRRDAIWGGFCSEVLDVVLGQKLGEGAQGDIYEAQVTFATDDGNDVHRKNGMRYGYVVKVMKSGYALQDLHRQRPQGLAALNTLELERRFFPLNGALVKDHARGGGRFGFVMHKRWGDLRRLVDICMERNNGKGPPFSAEQVTRFMCRIAYDMWLLHEMGITHRDLKAANVLVSLGQVSSKGTLDSLHVADWECSVGVVGTGFWRAPEILQQLKDKTPPSKLVFTKKMDVYSFAMTCYEICTRKVPFEDLPFSKTRDAILDGVRPELPHDMDSILRGIITRCWDSNPLHRLRFSTIFVNILRLEEPVQAFLQPKMDFAFT